MLQPNDAALHQRVIEALQRLVYVSMFDGPSLAGIPWDRWPCASLHDIFFDLESFPRLLNNLFIINAMDRKTPMVETYKAVILFVGSDLFRVALLVMFPAITLFLLPI